MANYRLLYLLSPAFIFFDVRRKQTVSYSGSGLGPVFWGLLLAGSLGASAGYVAILLGRVHYADVLALGRITYYDGGYMLLPIRLSAGGLLAAQWGFLAATMLCLAVAAGLLARPAGRYELRQLGQELRLAGSHWWAGLRQLPRAARYLAGSTLLLLTVARMVLSFANPLQTDELATYDFFISRGWLAAASFYPLPNNHLLLSVLGRLVYLLTPSFWLVLRLPVLLTATVATIGLFGGLLRASSFRVALLTITLFSSTELALYYAANGRGYWLLIGWAGLCFLAVVALLRPRPRARAAWVLLLLGSLLGCYTVPTFAYVAASALSYLAVVACLRRTWFLLKQTILAGLGIGASVAVLYAPVGLVSGWPALVANPYVKPLSLAYTWWHVPWFGWHTEGYLLGFDNYGMVALLLGLAGLAWLVWPTRWHHLPATQRVLLGRLLAPSLWFMGFPYALQLAQRVEAPVRVLLYKGLFSALLLSLLADAWLRQAARPRAVALGLLLLGLGSYHTAHLLHNTRPEQPDVTSYATYAQSLTWLLRQPPGPVLVQPHYTALYWMVLGHRRTARQPMQLATTARAHVQYRYLVVETGSEADQRLAHQGKPAYRDAVQTIYIQPGG